MREWFGEFVRERGHFGFSESGKGLEIDHLAVTEKMKAINAKFQVFSIQEVTNSPDTTIRFVAYSPICKSKVINIGEVWYRLRKDKVFGTLTQKRGIPK